MLSGLRPDNTQVYTLTEQTRSHLGDWVMLPEYFRNKVILPLRLARFITQMKAYEDPRSWDVEIREFGKRPRDGRDPT